VLGAVHGLREAAGADFGPRVLARVVLLPRARPDHLARGRHLWPPESTKGTEGVSRGRGGEGGGMRAPDEKELGNAYDCAGTVSAGRQLE